jgi:cysteinyl-tRNA synthetase
LMVDGEKMSKSLGNFLTVKDLLGQAPGEAIRLALLQSHYHQPLDWTAEGLRQAKTSLDRLYTALRNAEDVDLSDRQTETVPFEMMAALADDLNTPLAIAHLHELAGRLNKAHGTEERAQAKADLLAAGHSMGLLYQDPHDWFRWMPAEAQGLSDEAIEELISQRKAARAAKDFAKSDEIRAHLAHNGVILEDSAQGTTWKRGAIPS